ncbi:MAG: DMT family transporter [Candidatus Marinimicrobia bacterium]|nr:DMT family transporter [Candidatus Neomarinimicrobiota bacterium]
MGSAEKQSESRLTFYLLLAMAAWGLSWTNAKVLGEYADPPVIMVWRFIFATLSFAPVVYLTKNTFKISLNNGFHILLGAFFITSYNYLFFKGTQVGLASVGGVLVTTLNPVFTTLISALLLGGYLYRKDIWGLIFGFLGGLIILKFWEIQFDSFFQSGNLYFLLASISWGALTNVTSKGKDAISFMTFTFWCYLFSILLSLGLAKNSDLTVIFSFDWIFWLNMITVSVLAMAFATTTYFKGAVILGPKKVSSFIFTVPVTAILFAMVFLGESLEWSTILGGALAGFAVYLINQ